MIFVMPCLKPSRNIWWPSLVSTKKSQLNRWLFCLWKKMGLLLSLEFEHVHTQNVMTRWLNAHYCHLLVPCRVNILKVSSQKMFRTDTKLKWFLRLFKKRHRVSPIPVPFRYQLALSYYSHTDNRLKFLLAQKSWPYLLYIRRSLPSMVSRYCLHGCQYLGFAWSKNPDRTSCTFDAPCHPWHRVIACTDAST